MASSDLCGESNNDCFMKEKKNTIWFNDIFDNLNIIFNFFF